MPISIKSIIQSVDEQMFKTLVESAKGTCKVAEDIDAFVTSADVPKYKKAALREYADKNKDLLLAVDTHTELEPIYATDAAAPVAVEHGKVKNNIVNDEELVGGDAEEKPKAHPTRDVRTQVDEHRCIAILEDGTMEKVIVSDVSLVEGLIEEHFGQKCLVVFEETQPSDVIVEAALTDEQKEKRDNIVIALKKHSRELQRKYGPTWENVVYGIATKQAQGESGNGSPASVSEDANVLFTTKGKNGSTITISKDENGYYSLKQFNGKEVVDVQEFSSYEDAADAMHMLK